MTTRTRQQKFITKRIREDIITIIICVITLLGAAAGIAYMFFSTVLPVVIDGIAVIGNRILRYEIYIACLAAGVVSFVILDQTLNSLNKLLRKKMRNQ